MGGNVQALLGVPKSYNTSYYGVPEDGPSQPSIWFCYELCHEPTVPES